MGLWDVSHVREISGKTKGKAVGKRGRWYEELPVWGHQQFSGNKKIVVCGTEAG